MTNYKPTNGFAPLPPHEQHMFNIWLEYWLEYGDDDEYTFPQWLEGEMTYYEMENAEWLAYPYWEAYKEWTA